MLTTDPDEYSYLRDGEGKGRLAHRVILERELGRRLEEHEIVHHVDENKRNNDPSNFKIVTKAEHQKIHAKGARWDVEKALTMLREGQTYAEVARAMGITAMGVHRFLSRHGLFPRQRRQKL
jgi:hypothetical protein